MKLSKLFNEHSVKSLNDFIIDLQSMNRFQNKVAFVSGATAGIGLATSRRIGLEGAKVVIAAHIKEEVDATVALLRSEGIEAEGVLYNGYDMESVRESIKRVGEEYGHIDVLVNNVGGTDMQIDGPVDKLQLDYFETAFTLNLKGTLEAIRSALPYMPAGGSIVNVASIGGLTGDLRGTLYGIAKAGVIDLTKYVATQYGHRSIRCNAVAPGLILTRAATDNLPPLVREVFAAQTPLPYFGQPEDVGAPIAFLASDDARFVTGQTLVVDGGMLCHNPTALTLMNPIPNNPKPE